MARASAFQSQSMNTDPSIAAAEPAAGEASDNDILSLGAVDLSAAIHARRVSCVEVMTACLDQIDRLNPTVNAIVALRDRGELLAAAEERDEQAARGEFLGPLHGFPHAVKDIDAVKGLSPVGIGGDAANSHGFWPCWVGIAHQGANCVLLCS